MTKVAEKSMAPISNHNLKSVKPFRGNKGVVPSDAKKLENEVPKTEITDKAKALNAAEVENPSVPSVPSRAGHRFPSGYGSLLPIRLTVCPGAGHSQILARSGSGRL